MFPGLRVRWSKREKDLLFEYDKHKWDGHYLYSVFTKAFTAELESRGFDVTTLRFTVKRKTETKGGE